VAAERARPQGNGVTNGLGLLGLAGNASDNATPGAKVDGAFIEGFNPMGNMKESAESETRGTNRMPTDLPPAKIIEAAKKAAPAEVKKDKGMTGEDWLTLGLQLMSTKSPRFLTALGESGLGTLKAKKDREKFAIEQEKDAADAEYKKKHGAYFEAQGRYADAQAKDLAGGNKTIAMALEVANRNYDNWLQTVSKDPAAFAGRTEQDIAKLQRQMQQQFMNQAFAAFNIQPPAGLGGSSGFRVVGVR
jgi:hypothetical protein